ncbi:phytase [Marinomonas mediterranea]|uniref:phytase n=1 Tax=Marinomonas mediterranea TaxID=119864 RepID=UPI00234B8B69|nr:phytase [Marinomonas mediterranea]WCN10892.1 phytase [Marinomonas mediterranea]
MFKRHLLATAISSAMLASVSAHAAVISETTYEDIADAATWVSKDTTKSLLIATLEGDGIAVFNEQGKEIQHIEGIEALGADVRYSLTDDNGASMDIVAIGLPDEDSLGFYKITGDAKHPLSSVGTINIDATPEGVCLYQHPTSGQITATAYTEDGDLLQYKLILDGDTVKSRFNDGGAAEPVRHANVGGELSGCIVDDQSGTLYVAEQNIGVWKYGADAENVKDRAFLDVIEPHGKLEEIENIDLAIQEGGKGVILIADEGKGFNLYDRNSGEFLAKFDVEGVEEAKLVTTARNGIWIGNTEADEPVYQFMSADEFKTLSGVSLAGLQSNRDIKVAGVKVVTASGETDAVDSKGDAADDSTVWYNESNPAKSLIIATDKKGGLLAYDLDGNEVQFFEEGRPNNVDLRQNIDDGKGGKITLAAASNRDLNTVTLYTIDGSDTPIKLLPAIGNNVHDESPEFISNVDVVYGLCMGQGEDGTPYVFVNGKDGTTEQWKITLTKDGAKGDIVRTFSVESQPEGCVVDDETQTIYVGEEDEAIWTFDARENGSTKAKLFAAVDGKHLVDDIEGVTIYETDQVRYLIASSQGNNTYAVYDMNDNNQYKGSFAIIGDDDKGIDGTSDTDGVHAFSGNLGSAYPNGMFIAQDWYNINDEYELKKQNFKMVDWREIQSALKLK